MYMRCIKSLNKANKQYRKRSIEQATSENVTCFYYENGGFYNMQNIKILDMLNNGQINELKTQIQEEVFTEGLKNKPGAKQRYVAMKKYFSYTKNDNKALEKPCVITFRGEKYTSFINGYSITLTKESSGEIELFDEPDKYLNVEKMFVFDGEERKIDFNAIIAEAKSKGYKLKKSEVEQGNSFKYVFHYDDAYFKVGLLDCTYSIINDGKKASVLHPEGYNKKNSPIIIKNDIGICLILPFNYDSEKYNVTVIEVA